MDPLPLEEEHCTFVEVTEEEVKNSVKMIPSLPAVVGIRNGPEWTGYWALLASFCPVCTMGVWLTGRSAAFGHKQLWNTTCKVITENFPQHMFF